MNENIDGTVIFKNEPDIDNTRQHLYNSLWSSMVMAALAASEKIKKGKYDQSLPIYFQLNKDMVDEYKNYPLAFSERDGSYFIGKPQSTFNDDNGILYNYTWPNYDDINWFDIRKKMPPENVFFLAILYDDFPSTVVRQKNKYHIVIPPDSNKEKNTIFVEVTKGVRYWCFLPHKQLKSVKNLKKR